MPLPAGRGRARDDAGASGVASAPHFEQNRTPGRRLTLHAAQLVDAWSWSASGLTHAPPRCTLQCGPPRRATRPIGHVYLRPVARRASRSIKDELLSEPQLTPSGDEVNSAAEGREPARGGRWSICVEPLLRYQGFEICRTSAGHLVVVDPDWSRGERAYVVELLGDAGVLDALFFPNAYLAIIAIDEAIAAGIEPR